METVIETSMWVDFFRPKTPAAVKAQSKPGIVVNALDLLISTICVHHGAQLIAFDEHFCEIAKVSRLRVKVLRRAA